MKQLNTVRLKRHIFWIGTAIVTVIIFGTMYVVVQQAQRQAANNPQLQAAEDTAQALDNGANPNQVTAQQLDAGKSLGTFVVIYDKDGKAVAGTGLLNKELPKAPKGMLEASKGHEYSAVTWKPTSDLRFAAVTVASRDYYVVSARSLKEVEKNESDTLKLVALGTILSLIMLALTHSAAHNLWPFTATRSKK